MDAPPPYTEAKALPMTKRSVWRKIGRLFGLSKPDTASIHRGSHVVSEKDTAEKRRPPASWREAATYTLNKVDAHGRVARPVLHYSRPHDYYVTVTHLPVESHETQDVAPWMALVEYSGDCLATYFPQRLDWRDNLDSCFSDEIKLVRDPRPGCARNRIYRRYIRLGAGGRNSRSIWVVNVRFYHQDHQWLAGVRRAKLQALLRPETAMLAEGWANPSMRELENHQLFYREELKPGSNGLGPTRKVKLDLPLLHQIVDEHLDM